jgi:hypothetical protein
LPAAHLSLNYHVIFSTKDRVPEIAVGWRKDLHSYLGGFVKGVEGEPLIVGGRRGSHSHADETARHALFGGRHAAHQGWIFPLGA